MKIVVCIKQVPGTSQVEIDPETGVLKRDGAAAKINPYDLYALETAMRLKERCGGTVTAVTMGPPQAEAMMKEAYMMGVDQAYVFTDRTFAGADVLATSYTLAQGITSICDYDIIICGKQTTDGDTAQVGPAMAEYLGIPCAAWVGEIADVDDASVTVGQDFFIVAAGKNETSLSAYGRKRHLYATSSVLSSESSDQRPQGRDDYICRIQGSGCDTLRTERICYFCRAYFPTGKS